MFLLQLNKVLTVRIIDLAIEFFFHVIKGTLSLNNNYRFNDYDVGIASIMLSEFQIPLPRLEFISFAIRISRNRNRIGDFTL